MHGRRTACERRGICAGLLTSGLFFTPVDGESGLWRTPSAQRFAACGTGPAPSGDG